MKGKWIIAIVLVGLMISGCSVSSPSDQIEHKEIENQEQTTEGNGKNEAKSEEPKETSTTDIAGTEEAKEYVFPETILNITGMTAEEQVESFRTNNVGNRRFEDVEVTEENALVLTMTEKQKKLYTDEIRTRIYEDIEKAREKDDIYIEINEDYSRVKVVLGEDSSVTGFHVILVKISSEVGVYQILSGCEPEQWGFRLIAEKGEEVLVDANVPHGSWKLTGEDFGE